MRNDAHVLMYSYVVLVVCAVVLIAYHRYDPYKNIERHYFHNSRPMYFFLRSAYFVLFVSAIICARQIVMGYFKKMTGSR